MDRSIEAQQGPMPHAGSSLLALAIVFAALVLCSVAAIAFPTGGQRVPSPFGPASQTTSFFVSHRASMRVAAFFQLGAAIVLGAFTGTVTSRLRFLGVRAAGVHIAFLGGAVASVFMALSALAGWILGQEECGGSIDLLHQLHLWQFATGGFGLVAGLGLLLAGVSVAGGLARLLPRWLTGTGLAIAVVAELATLGLVAPALVGLIQVVRIGCIAWMITLGAMLPTSRAPRVEPARPSAPPDLRPARQT
jgi:hypothetical protein